MKEQDAVRGGRIDVLLHALKPDPSSLQLPNTFDQIFQGSPQAIQLPDDERIPSADELERRLETLALSGRAAGHIGEEFLAASFLERVALQLELLILGIRRAWQERTRGGVSKATRGGVFGVLTLGWVVGRIPACYSRDSSRG